MVKEIVHTDQAAVTGAPLVQAICCGTSRAEWIGSARGLSPTEAAMHVALPECDGRVISVPISFKENHRYQPDLERVQRAAGLAPRRHAGAQALGAFQGAIMAALSVPHAPARLLRHPAATAERHQQQAGGEQPGG